MTEVLVIGGGVYGLSTALSLARGKYKDNPEKILVVDRSANPPELDAASSDINKIVRPDYCDAVYAGLAQKAIDKWMKDPVWQPYFTQSGILVASSAFDGHGEKYVRGSYQQQQNLQKAGHTDIEPVMIDSQELFSKAMGQKDQPLGPKPLVAYWNQVAGWGWARGAMEAMAKECREAGVSFTSGLVTELIIEDGDVRGAKTKDGRELRASRLTMLAAGSWSPAVFPELATKLTATGQALATIALTPEEAKQYAKAPVYIDMNSGFYVFPPDKDNIVKCALHLRGWTNEQPSLCDVAQCVSTPRTGHYEGTLDDHIPLAAVRALRHGLQQIWPDLANKPFEGTRLCWYCDSKDCDFLISYHDKYPSLFLATGDSGHGYKFLPTIGDLCVQAIDNTLPEPYANMWSWTRERQDYQPDRGTSVRIPLVQAHCATNADLIVV